MTDDEDNINSNDSRGRDFQPRPIERPLFGTDMQNRLSRSEDSGGLAGFYRANKIYFWAGLLGLALIALVSYIAFHQSGSGSAQEAKVTVAIEVPETVSSGGEAVYRIKVENQDPEKLARMELELVYPEGVSFVDSSPKPSNLSGTSFAVPDLASGQNAVVVLKTKVSGSVGDSKELLARLHYSFSNFSSEFIKENRQSVRIIASDVVLDLSGPATGSSGQLVMYTLQYENNSDGDFQNVRIQLSYADGFQFASADPQPDLGNNIWNVGTLAKGGSGTIQIQGSFNSTNPGETKTTQAELQILSGSGQYLSQGTASFVTALSDQPLMAAVSLSSASADTGTADPGDTLSYTVKYKNNASVAANAVNVVVTLEGKALDLATLQSQNGQMSGDTITWNAASDPSLQVISPGQSGELRFSVRVKNPATKDSSKNLSVIARVKIKSNEYDTFFPGGDVTVKITSPVSLSASASYASGQYPPKVGAETSYKITFTINNSTNDFSNTAVTAFIPLGAGGFDVSGVNAAEQKNVVYDPATGKLTWNVGALPAHTGQFSASKTLEFTVRLTPSSSQVGQSPVLIKTIALDATDIFTAKSVHTTARDLDTSAAQQGSSGGGQVGQ